MEEVSPRNIFCLEGYHESDSDSPKPTQATLEVLAENDAVLISYKTCSDFEEFEFVLSDFLYEDKEQCQFEIIYLAFDGKRSHIFLNDEYLSLEEIANRFEGRFTNKMIHFGGNGILNLTDDELHYFMEITQAVSISGYSLTSPLLASLTVDALFLDFCQQEDDLLDIKLGFYKKYTRYCEALGFRMYC